MIIRQKLNTLNPHISQTILFFIFIFCFSSNQFIYESVLFQRSLIREPIKLIIIKDFIIVLRGKKKNQWLGDL